MKFNNPWAVAVWLSRSFSPKCFGEHLKTFFLQCKTCPVLLFASVCRVGRIENCEVLFSCSLVWKYISCRSIARWKEKKSWGIYDNFYLIKAQATSIVACGNQNQLISKFESDSRALDGIRLKVIANKKKLMYRRGKNCDGIIKEQS